MDNIHFGNNSSPDRSNLRAIVSQVRCTQRWNKALTVENIVTFGSGHFVPPTPRKLEGMLKYLQDAVSGGYLQCVDGEYSLTPLGGDLLGDNVEIIPETFVYRPKRLKQGFGRSLKGTRRAVGTIETTPRYHY